MNGQISDEMKKRPWRNWNVPSRTRVRGGLRVSKMTPSESLALAEMAERIKFGRY